MLGHDGDLVAVHTENLALQVDELTLTYLHIVPRLEVVLPFLPCRGRHGADMGAACHEPPVPPWPKLQTKANTCALSHHLQVNALRLVLKLLQLRECGLHTLCDLSPKRQGEEEDVSQCHRPAEWAKDSENYSPRDTPDLRVTLKDLDNPLLQGLGCRKESLASPLPTAISTTLFGTLTTADMAKLLNRKPFRL